MSLIKVGLLSFYDPCVLKKVKADELSFLLNTGQRLTTKRLSIRQTGTGSFLGGSFIPGTFEGACIGTSTITF